MAARREWFNRGQCMTSGRVNGARYVAFLEKRTQFPGEEMNHRHERDLTFWWSPDSVYY